VRILLFGASGLLGRALVPEIEGRGWEVHGLRRSHVDVTDREGVRDVVAPWRGDWVVNLAAYTAVDQAEREPDRAFAVNREGAENVALAARRVGARLLHLSTDYVFDGRRDSPYPPDARASPLNVYGRSKLEGEEAVLGVGGRPLVVRTSWLYGAGGRNFVDVILDRGRRGERVEVVTDQRGRPTWTRSLARTLVLLMRRDAGRVEEAGPGAGPEGILHAADGGDATWWELAREAFRLEGIEPEPVPVESARFRSAARRPGYSVLDTSATVRILGEAPPHWTEALAAYLRSRGPDHRQEEPIG
jgi:dTDP-4-dehydrorhamnose reductase